MLCQAHHQSIGEKEWTEMHEKFEEFCKTVVVKTSGRSVVRAR